MNPLLTRFETLASLAIQAPGRPCVVALGMFDGLHRGHQAVLRHTVARARELGVSAAVFTFANHPQHVLLAGAEPPIPLLTPADEKAEGLAALGLDTLVMIPFDDALQTLSAEAFETDVLQRGLRAIEVLAGEDFRYGRSRLGNMERLRQVGPSLGFDVGIVPLLSDPGPDGQPIKLGSRKIREALQGGQLDQANRWLGRPYQLTGQVEAGQQRGGPLLNTPTANLKLPCNKLIPKAGVYAGQATLGECSFAAVANVGLNPTFNELRQPRVEVHLLNYEGPSFYGKTLSFQCEHFLRVERPFESLEALKTQIAEDIRQTRQLLGLETAR